MKLGIDLDMTLNNELEIILRFYNEKYNDSLTLDDIHCWDISKYVKCGKEIFNLLNNETLIEKFQPLPHSIEITRKLVEKHELYIVTATKSQSARTKVNWLKQHYPHIKEDNIIFCKNKSLLSGLDLLIDDGLHNILNFPKGAIIMDYAWNRDAPDFYPRAKNWLEIEQMLSKYDF